MCARPFSITQTALALVASLLLIPASAQAQFVQPVPLWQTVISDSALSHSSGNIGINLGAGNGNAQANMTAIAIGDAPSAAQLYSKQQAALNHASDANVPGAALAGIGPGAFQGASGAIKVNQASGSANTQVNMVALAVATHSEVSIDQLGQVSASTQLPNGSSVDSVTSKGKKVEIADSAFIGARGVVQVSQLAGSLNSTANIFILHVSVP